MNFLNVFRGLFKKQKGQGLVEYAFIIILIALGVIVALGYLGTAVSNFFNDFSSLL
jgi:pilus assembly protein Flp/PilA